jgi:hypothetical protein
LKISTVVSFICLALQISSLMWSRVQILSSSLSSLLACSNSPPLYFLFSLRYGLALVSSQLWFCTSCFSSCLILVLSHLGFCTGFVLAVVWPRLPWLLFGIVFISFAVLIGFVRAIVCHWFLSQLSIAVWLSSFSQFLCGLCIFPSLNLVLTLVPNVPGPDNLQQRTILFSYFSLSKSKHEVLSKL